MENEKKNSPSGNFLQSFVNNAKKYTRLTGEFDITVTSIRDFKRKGTPIDEPPDPNRCSVDYTLHHPSEGDIKLSSIVWNNSFNTGKRPVLTGSSCKGKIVIVENEKDGTKYQNVQSVALEMTPAMVAANKDQVVALNW